MSKTDRKEKMRCSNSTVPKTFSAGDGGCWAGVSVAVGGVVESMARTASWSVVVLGCILSVVVSVARGDEG